jgi:hypothetical protein
MKLNTYWKMIIGIIIFFVVINVILYFGTQFTKNITIKDKYIRYRRSASNYHVVDVEGNIYQIRNVWFMADFNRAEDYQTLEKGKIFNVSGYGIRIPFLGMYPSIYRVN